MSDEEWNNFGEKLGTALLGAILILFLLLSLLTQHGCAGRTPQRTGKLRFPCSKIHPCRGRW